MSDLPLLSLVIWVPIVGAMLVLACQSEEKAPLARILALAVSVVTFLISVLLYTGFDLATHEMQFVERVSWIPAFNVFYHLGVDGISMPLIILTTFSTVLVVLAGWQVIKHKPALYMASFLIMMGFMNGVFASLDAVLFYVFWEALLIPMFLVIGIWGGPRRVYATIKFFLYTFFGSVFMLIALIYMYMESGSFGILDMQDMPLGMTAQTWIFLAFLIAFAVKVPMWPVHTWLPDAHVEAPTGGSVILAAIMLKLGAYGFLRFSLPITPDASADLAWLVITLSLIGIVYIGFVALAQSDMKKLVAYSSISHMGFVTLGLFIPFLIFTNTGSLSGAAMGLEGAMVQMISHGFVSGAMFLCIGVLYDRMHSREISSYGGVAEKMPWFAAFVVLFSMANAGLPGTSGFVGEFMVILAAFKANFWIAFLAATTLIIGAAYTLWMVKRVIFGEVTNEGVEKLEDLNKREFFILAVLAVAVLVLGLWPAPLLEVMHPTVDNLIHQISSSKL
ncbi:NADH-ubiquinone oxidoreductase chain M [hydrothermal vent metagenome]|uniref:NADH-ubiquinone oxidoreductase chain M n=1 Tax=hydrothermal vent metagenome TaxID=652676 RepID=A0A3B0ZD77_9ZZZZ